MSFNKIIVVGNLGRDPELNYTGQGKAVCHFTVASNEKRRDKAGELQDVTTWFRVTLWGNQAETASKYLQKGAPVYVEGRLRLDEWTDRDGKTRQTLEVQGTDLQLIGSAPQSSFADEAGGGQRGAGRAAAASGGATGAGEDERAEPRREEIRDDDIPF